MAASAETTTTLAGESHALLVAIARANNHPDPTAWADTVKGHYENPQAAEEPQASEEAPASVEAE